MFRLTFVLRDTRRNDSEGIFLFAKISNLNICHSDGLLFLPFFLVLLDLYTYTLFGYYFNESVL